MYAGFLIRLHIGSAWVPLGFSCLSNFFHSLQLKYRKILCSTTIKHLSLLLPTSKQICKQRSLCHQIEIVGSGIVLFITWAGVVTTYWVKVLLIHCWNWVIYYRVASHKEMMIYPHTGRKLCCRFWLGFFREIS